MFTNSVAIDYLTLTTWHQGAFDSFEQAAYGHAVEPLREARRMQYQGTVANNVFVGRGTQGGKRHYMLQASGMDAHIIAPYVAYLPATCTRIDVQATVRLPSDFSPAYVATDLREWRGPGRKREVVYVQSGDDLDTIYIGSRNSRRLIRLYVKEAFDGAKWLRLEVEYKRELAQSVWDEIRAGMDGDILRGLLLHEAQSVPGLLEHCGMAMRQVLHGDATKPEAGREVGDNNTLKWLDTQVKSAFIRAMADHDIGQVARDMARLLAIEADSIETHLSDGGEPFVSPNET